MAPFYQSIRSKLLLVLLLPSLLAGGLLYLETQLNLANVEKQESIKRVVVLSEGLAQVAHNFAVERGLSAGYLGSGGNSGSDKLAAQRQKADTAAQFFFSNLSTLKQLQINQTTLTLLEGLKLNLENRQQVRSLVDDLDPTSNFFAFYSGINSQALQLVEQLATLIGDPKLQASYQSYTSLLWLKERAGQSRGALNGVFSSGNLSEDKASVIKNYIRQQQVQLDKFEQFANETERKLLQAQMSPQVSEQVDEMRAVFSSEIELKQRMKQFEFALLSQNSLGSGSVAQSLEAIESTISPNQYAQLNQLSTSYAQMLPLERFDALQQIEQISVLSQVSASDWFEQATKRIVAINKVANGIKQTITQQAQSNIDVATGLVTRDITITGVILALSMLLGLWIAQGVVSSLKQVQSAMAKISETLDFSTRVHIKSSDEIGQTAESVNQLLQSLQATFSDIREYSRALASGELDQAKFDKSYTGDLNQLTRDLQQASDSLNKGVTGINESMWQVRQGNFDQPVTASLAGDFAELKDNVNSMLLDIKSMVSDFNGMFESFASGDLAQLEQSRFKGLFAQLSENANIAVGSLQQVIELDVQQVIKQAQVGDLSARIELGDKRGCFRQLSEGINTIMTNNQLVVSEVSDVFAALECGRLDRKMIGAFSGEFAKLKTSANQTIDTLTGIIEQDIENVVANTVDGSLVHRIDITNKRGAFLSLSEKINQLCEVNSEITNNMNKVFAALAEGKLSQFMEGDYKGEFAQLQTNTNNTIAKLSHVIEREIETVVSAALEGDLSERIDVVDKQGFFLNLSNKVNDLVIVNDKVLTQTDRVLSGLSKGDLSHVFEGHYAGRFQQLQQNANRTISNLKQIIEIDVQRVIEEVNQGNLEARVSEAGKAGCFNQLAKGINQIIGCVELVFSDLSYVLSGMEKGEMSHRVQGEYEGQFEAVKDSCNQSIEQFSQVIGRVDEMSTALESGLNEIAQANGDLSARTESQAASVEETASSVSEMSSSSAQTQQYLEQSQHLLQDAVGHAKNSEEVVTRALHSMRDITEASQKIEAIIGVIDEIAFQTNLLALNASVEAARAGEEGRGFNVVAGEVRNLAQRSASSASEIKTLINDSVVKVEQGTVEVQRTSDSLSKIVQSVHTANEEMAKVVLNTSEQVKGIDQINSAITHIDDGIQQNSAMVEQVASASAELADKAKFMKQAVRFFKLEPMETVIASYKGISEVRS